MTGTDTQVQIYAGLISENQSPNGTGVYINDGANLEIARLTQACWDPVKCN